MKRIFIAFLTLALIFCCTFTTACADGGGFVFTFLSVRLKGNGDGTVTACAQNEFALSAGGIPVTLELYRLNADEEYELCDRVFSDSLCLSGTLSVSVTVGEKSSFYACIIYEVNGEIRRQSTARIVYGVDGNRVM